MALTGEDKQWLRGEIQQAKDEMNAGLQSMEARLKEYTDHSKDETIIASRDMQTEVLTYIANLAEPINTRIRHVEANAGNLETAERKRLAAIEDRLLRIEKKLGGGLP